MFTFTGFLSQVSRLGVLAWSLPPLHVSDGESVENSKVQLHQRGSGLCGRPSRADTAGNKEVIGGFQSLNPGLYFSIVTSVSLCNISPKHLELHCPWDFSDLF